MDRGARWATVHGVAESTEQLTLRLSGLCQVLGKGSDFWSWASVVTADGLFLFFPCQPQLRRNGFGKNGFLQSRSSSLFSPWRSTCRAEFEDSDTETSSSETSDDDAWK